MCVCVQDMVCYLYYSLCVSPDTERNKTGVCLKYSSAASMNISFLFQRQKWLSIWSRAVPGTNLQLCPKQAYYETLRHCMQYTHKYIEI